MSRPKRVWVYRNLKHGKKARPLYSIMRNGRVMARRHRVLLTGVQFIVREAGRQRVLRERRKNVHAFAVGFLAGSKGAFGTDHNDKKGFPVKLKYNPYEGSTFRTLDGEPVKGARGVLLNEHGMSACYLE